jgi:hypothetical protein
MWLSL